MTSHARCFPALMLMFACCSSPSALGQVAASGVVTGQVRNAVSSAPITRVLVQLGSAAVFTDHNGNFSLADSSATGGTVLLTKPGYFTSPERIDAQGIPVTAAALAHPLDLRLYPEALLTGAVMSQDGDPLGAVPVTARRLVSTEAGRRFEVVTSVQTDSHGAFRLAVPAGDYQVTTQFVGASGETGLATLPAVYPAGVEGGTVHVGSGEQQQFELRPHTGIPHTVELQLRGLLDDRSPEISVATSSGATWQVGADFEPNDDRASIRLPAGAYRLRASSGDGERKAVGETLLTVPDHTLDGVVVQLTQMASMPVEVRVDAQATSVHAPSVQQLGLQLVPEQQGALLRSDRPVRPQGYPGQAAVLLPEPGQYRLIAVGRGSWFVESATYGGAEVLGQVLTVVAGSGSSPLQLVVSNLTGSLAGTVTASGSPTPAWIALIPSFPSAIPVITLRAASDGSFSQSSLQPGSYVAVALEHATGADLENATVRGSLGLQAQTFTIAAGTRATLQLELSEAGDSTP